MTEANPKILDGVKDPRTDYQKAMNSPVAATCGGEEIVVFEMSLAQIEAIMSKFAKVIAEVMEKADGVGENNIADLISCVPMAAASVRAFLEDLLLWKNSKGVSKNPDLTPAAIGDCLQSELIDILTKFIQVNPAARRVVGKSPALGKMFGLIGAESATESPRA